MRRTREKAGDDDEPDGSFEKIGIPKSGARGKVRRWKERERPSFLGERGHQPNLVAETEAA